MQTGNITVREMLQSQVGNKANSIISVLDDKYQDDMSLIEFKNLIEDISKEYDVPVVNLSIIFPFVPIKSN